jgi:Xaa-Pro dipeptidase
MEYLLTPKSEIDARIENLQNELQKNDFAAAVIVQSADLFYFTGTCQNSHLIVPQKGEPILGIKKDFERGRKESPLKNVFPLKSLKKIISYVSSFNIKGKIGMELDVLPTNLFFRYKNLFSDFEIIDISSIIRSVRMIKSDYEIGLLKETAIMNNAMFSKAASVIKESETELEASSLLEAEFRKLGHQGIVRVRGFNMDLFYGQFMSGKNGGVPSFFDGPSGGMGLHPSYPQGVGFKKINKNEPIMIDFVGVKNGYLIDQARVFSIENISDDLTYAHNTALEIKNEFIKKAGPGVNGKDLFDDAFKKAEEKGLKDYFMGYKENQVSFIAHGIGIELDEFPIIAKNLNFILKKGMIFALEPKFIFPDKGVVGIEDTFCITENGIEQVSFFDDDIQVL